MDPRPVELPDSVTLITGQGNLPAVRVESARCTGEVYLHGAHVTDWAPSGQDPVIWLSEHSTFVPGRAIRGGIPLSAPWFADGRTGDMTPAHGWFRTSTWEFTGAQDVDGTVSLAFHLDGADVGHPTISADYVVEMGEELTLELAITTQEPLVLENALHTYLAVADIDAVSVRGLEGCHYVDKAPGGLPDNIQQGEVTFAGETDRVYTHDGAAQVIDPAAGRLISLTKSGSSKTVVWNPAVAKSAAMADFGDEEWRGMMCLEVANALDGVIPLEAGGSHTMRATYAVAST
ncbi:D-hexose-6-phosphate mutarotase [Serinibacter salmoneus]|nr:D-hexose-6-phosphate mutarotase [Serinibacter salmoneus]